MATKYGIDLENFPYGFIDNPKKKDFSNNREGVMNNKNGNILEPLVDSLIGATGLFFKAAYMGFDMLGNVMYRIIEGKPFEASTDGPEDSVDVLNLVKYEYIPLENSEAIKMGDKISYKYVEGEKEGLSAIVGVTISDEYKKIDLTKGHLIVGGMSNWGKSSFIKVLLAYLIQTYTTNEVMFIGCDYAWADVFYFRRYKHFKGMSTDQIGLIEQLNWIKDKMKERSKIFMEEDVWHIKAYNETHDKKMSYIVFVIDELVQVVENEDIKNEIHRIMSKCFKFGIIFILASQDLTKATIGKCKINCSQVVGFKTYDSTDSETILGKGHDLYKIENQGRCKIKNSEGIEETQIFYIEDERMKEILRPYEKEVF